MLRQIDLKKLNTLTKYPSIPTYHALGEKGALLDEYIPLPDEVILTEKLDGTNVRIVLVPDREFTPAKYLIGSREEFLHAEGDLIWNPSMGIVEALRPLAEGLDLVSPMIAPQPIWVIYGELFGGKVTANSKQYSGEQKVSYRLFDVVCIPNWKDLLEQPIEAIAQWREQGGQQFLNEDDLLNFGEDHGLNPTPRLLHRNVPTSHEEVLEWLKTTLPKTHCSLDEKAGGRPEGVVVRTIDRSTIVKIRYEDYERHLRRKNK